MNTIRVILLAIVVLAVGCKSNEKGGKALLTAHEWQLEKISGVETELVMPEQMPTLLFSDSTSIFGMAGCNRFFGQYAVEGKNQLQIKPGGMTMMFCPDMQFEDQYVKLLAKVASFTGTEERIQLTDSTGKVILFFVPRDSSQLIGVAEDAHGCNAAAGYTWSEVQQRCLRLFESGVKLLSATDTTASLAAYVVFSPDSLSAEVFIPEMSEHPVLDRRTLPAGGYAWNVEDDDTYNVRLSDGKWVIEKRANVLYVQE